MMKSINDFRAYVLKHADTLTDENKAEIIAFASWVKTVADGYKTDLNAEYGTGKHIVGAYTVNVSEIAPSMTPLSGKEFAALGITPDSKPDFFKEKSGSIRVSVK